MRPVQGALAGQEWWKPPRAWTGLSTLVSTLSWHHQVHRCISSQERDGQGAATLGRACPSVQGTGSPALLCVSSTRLRGTSEALPHRGSSWAPQGVGGGQWPQ